MDYRVWVSATGDTNHVVLSDGADGDKASELAKTLVSSAQGSKFSIGIDVDTTDGPPQAGEQVEQEQPPKLPGSKPAGQGPHPRQPRQ